MNEDIIQKQENIENISCDKQLNNDLAVAPETLESVCGGKNFERADEENAPNILPQTNGDTAQTETADEDSDSEEIVDIPLSLPEIDDGDKSPDKKPKKKSNKKIWSLLLFIAVNVIVIGITAIMEFNGEETNDHSTLSAMADSIAHNWYYLICAAACFLGIYAFQSIKVSRMIRVTTGQAKVRATINSVILGKYYDNITPLAIGGQPFQAYYLNKNKIPIGTAMATPIVQLFLGTCGFITIALVAFIGFSGEVDSTFIRVCAYIGLVLNAFTPTAIALFSLFPNMTIKVVSFAIKVLAKIHIVKDANAATHKAIATINDYRASIGFMCRSKSTMLIGYLLSILEKLSEMSITYFVILACFNGTGNYIHITAMTIFIYAATSFIPTPGTAGAAEGSFYIVFGSFWPMFIWRLFSYYFYLIFGLIVIISNSIRRRRILKKHHHQ